MDAVDKGLVEAEREWEVLAGIWQARVALQKPRLAQKKTCFRRLVSVMSNASTVSGIFCCQYHDGRPTVWYQW